MLHNILLLPTVASGVYYVSSYGIAGLMHFIRFRISSEMGGETDGIARDLI